MQTRRVFYRSALNSSNTHYLGFKTFYYERGMAFLNYYFFILLKFCRMKICFFRNQENNAVLCLFKLFNPSTFKVSRGHRISSNMKKAARNVLATTSEY